MKLKPKTDFLSSFMTEVELETLKVLMPKEYEGLMSGIDEYAKHYHEIKMSESWVDYNPKDRNTYPKKYGKYFVCRKDGKVHWETWNGVSFAYNNNVITRYKEVT